MCAALALVTNDFAQEPVKALVRALATRKPRVAFARQRRHVEVRNCWRRVRNRAQQRLAARLVVRGEGGDVEWQLRRGKAGEQPAELGGGLVGDRLARGEAREDRGGGAQVDEAREEVSDAGLDGDALVLSR